MPARRCPGCLRNYDAYVERCPLCGGPTDYMLTATPDRGWRADVERELNRAGCAAWESEQIVAWRMDELVRAGYDLRDAATIAARFQGPDAIDLHQAVGLLESGCDVTTAIEILL